ncbi:bifunctional protein glmu-like protein [Plakobranchus ocellatus]|uniref:Bifunctional protein glmu-like protein n=1 Tax=Plakobranchus ocellatus TaxID=259542 RepID=A0AAV4B0Z8_9GAST|nr:bifunctional protein glmu-like protein [Plakobranchus ocellatus]
MEKDLKSAHKVPFSPALGTLQCHPLRVEPGQELRSTLSQFVRARHLNSAFVLTCVGSVTSAHLRMANATETKLYDKGPYEIVSLVGTLSGGSCGHLHASLSDADGSVVGGHVLDQMVVHTTAEVVIGNVGGVVFTREFDHRTGYDELCVKGQEDEKAGAGQ